MAGLSFRGLESVNWTCKQGFGYGDIVREKWWNWCICFHNCPCDLWCYFFSHRARYQNAHRLEWRRSGCSVFWGSGTGRNGDGVPRALQSSRKQDLHIRDDQFFPSHLRTKSMGSVKKFFKTSSCECYEACRYCRILMWSAYITIYQVHILMVVL